MSKFVEVKINYYINPALLRAVSIPNREVHLESIKSQRDTYAEKETSLIEKLMSLKPDEREPYLERLNKYTNEKTRLSVFLEQESKWWDLIIVTNEGVDLNFRYDKESERDRVVNEIIGRSTPTYAE